MRLSDEEVSMIRGAFMYGYIFGATCSDSVTTEAIELMREKAVFDIESVYGREA